MPKPVTDLPDSLVSPAPASEKRTRRRFSTEYKLRIITEAEACKRGELGALLRRENLDSNQLQQLRREFAEHGVQGLGKSLPGPSPSKTPEQRRIAELEKANARLTRKLQITDDCLDPQKNFCRCSIAPTMGAICEPGPQ